MEFLAEKKYYEILGVTENASLDNIVKAYYREKFENSYIPFWEKDKIEEAFKVLSDPEMRKKYDKFLKTLNLDNSVEISKPLEQLDTKLSESVELPSTPQLEEKESVLSIEQPEPKLEIKKEEIKPIVQPSKPVIRPMTLSELAKEGPIFHDIESIDKDHSYLTYQNAKNLGYVGKDNMPYISPTQDHPEEILKDVYDQKLNRNINRLINKNYKNYDLEITRLRYENQIELTKKIIEFKNNQKIHPDKISERQIEINNLNSELSTLKQKLQKVNEKIENYNKETSLSRINKKIEEVEKDIEVAEQSISFNFLTVKKLELKKRYYELRQKTTFNRIKLINGFISKTKNGISDNYNKGKNFVTSVAQNIKNSSNEQEYIEEPILIRR